MTRFSSRWILFVALAALPLSACGDDDGGTDAATDARRDTSTRDTGRDTDIEDSSRSDSTADACEGLANREGRCDGDSPVVCIGGRLVRRSCEDGYECREEDSRARCRCDLEADGECVEGCPDDPDCAGCTPDCSGRDCGSDGCGGICGECTDGTICSEDDQCIEVDGICDDSCEFAADGECDDGGPESAYDVCDYGTDCTDCGIREEVPVDCRLNYNLDCAPGTRCECNEADGSCFCEPGARGTGPIGSACSAQSDCESGFCVDDRCSRVCDTGAECEAPLELCQPFLGACVEGSCEPACGGGRECGDDGCGGSCGDCPGGGSCVAGVCQDETPSSGHTCPGRADCEPGFGCCISSSEGNPAGCLEHGSPREMMCSEAAMIEETYGYLGCHQDSDCSGGQVCCAGESTTACAASCGGTTAATCNLRDPDCGSDASLRCCPVAAPFWFEGEYDVGRCITSCD